MSMQHKPAGNTALKLFLLLLAAVPLVWGVIDQIWSDSTDLAHHYALVSRLMQTWTLPPGVDMSLGEMNYYPRLSHQVSALLGAPFGSALIGMQLAGGLSLFVIWAGLSSLLLALPRRAGWVCSALLAGLMFVNSEWIGLYLHGWEVRGFYFFAQMVGHAFAIGAALAALAMERRGLPSWWRHGFLIAAVWVTCCVHLLPASELLGFMALSVALDVLQRGWPRSRKLVLLLLRDGALVVGGALLFLRHPDYLIMKTISHSNGSLQSLYIHTAAGMTWFCLAIAVLAGLLAWRWLRLARKGEGQNLLALKYLALYALAVAGMAIVQLIMRKVGLGSDYAVKKHLVALNSMLLLLLALLPALLPWLRKERAAASGNGAVLLHRYALPVALAALCFVFVTPKQPGVDVSELVKVERQFELRRDLYLSAAPKREVYVLDMPGMHRQFEYMYSLGVFSASRAAAYDIWKPMAEVQLNGVVMTAQGSSLSKLDTCQLPGSSTAFPMLDGSCVSKAVRAPRRVVALGVNDGPPPCKLVGFSQPEVNGAWSVAPELTLTCPRPEVDGKPARAVTLWAASFVPGNHAQRVSISVNGGTAQSFRYDAAHAEQKLVLALPATAAESVTLQVQLPDAVSPQSLKLSDDARQLGLMLRSISFD
jgi:hypothetical protein